MAQQIIARGKVKRALHDGPTLTFRYLLNAGEGKLYVLGAWARPYIGKTIVISLEEPEEERDPIANQAFVGVLEQA